MDPGLRRDDPVGKVGCPGVVGWDDPVGGLPRAYASGREFALVGVIVQTGFGDCAG